MGLEEIIKKIDETEKSCYLGNNEVAIPKIMDIINFFDKEYNDIPDILVALQLLYTALEKKDYILVADYLEFAIKNVLLGNTIPACILDSNLVESPIIDEDLFYLLTCSEELTLCVKCDNGQVLRLNSCISPIHETEVVFSSLKIKKTTPAVCLFGIGTGMLSEKVLERLPYNGKLIIYEPTDSIVNYCLSCSKCIDCDESEKRIGERLNAILDDQRTYLYFSEQEQKTFVNFISDKLDYRDLYGLIIGINSGYGAYSPKKCLDFIHNIEDFRRVTITNKNTIIRFEDYYVEHIFRNLIVCKQMNLAREIKKILPTDIPVIIVSAGPSLQKNAELLKMVKGHFFIVAVDSAVKFLMSKDIMPDLTITIDPIKPVECYKDERALAIPCIIDLDCNCKITEKLKGRKFLLARNTYLINQLKALNKNVIVDPLGGGSVATVIFALLCDIGIKKIILIGQDLASSGGKTHAGDENDGPLGDKVVEGIDGSLVSTRFDWYNYLKWFEIYIKNLKTTRNDFVVIDATEGGAKINGTEIMTLQAAIDGCRDSCGNLPDYSFEKEVKRLDYFLDENDYRTFCNNHKKNIEKLQDLKVKADEVVRICKELIKGIENKTISSSYINKKKKVISKIHAEYMDNPMYYLINKNLNGAVVDTVSRLSLAEGDAEEQEKNGIMLLQVSFENIARVSDLLYENAKKYESLL